MWVPVALYSWQHLVLSVLLIWAILSGGCVMVSHYGLIFVCISCLPNEIEYPLIWLSVTSMALSFNLEQEEREMSRGLLSMKVCDCWVWEGLGGAFLLLEDKVEGSLEMKASVFMESQWQERQWSADVGKELALARALTCCHIMGKCLDFYFCEMERRIMPAWQCCCEI